MREKKEKEKMKLVFACNPVMQNKHLRKLKVFHNNASKFTLHINPPKPKLHFLYRQQFPASTYTHT